MPVTGHRNGLAMVHWAQGSSEAWPAHPQLTQDHKRRPGSSSWQHPSSAACRCHPLSGHSCLQYTAQLKQLITQHCFSTNLLYLLTKHLVPQLTKAVWSMYSVQPHFGFTQGQKWIEACLVLVTPCGSINPNCSQNSIYTGNRVCMHELLCANMAEI